MKNKSSHITTGLLIIILGLLLLAVMLNIFSRDFFNLLCSGPSLIIIVGLLLMTMRNYRFGSFVALVGVFFLLPRLSTYNDWQYFPSDFTDTYWPLLIVLFGIYILFGCSFGKSHGKHNSCNDGTCFTTYEEVPDDQTTNTQKNASNNTTTEDSTENTTTNKTSSSKNQTENTNARTDYKSEDTSNSTIELNRKVMLSQWKYKAPQADFNGGKVETTMSDVEIDLRNAHLSKDSTLLLANLLSDMKIFVPAEWNIKIEIGFVAGGVKDLRNTPTSTQGPQLILSGNCTLGSISLYE